MMAGVVLGVLVVVALGADRLGLQIPTRTGAGPPLQPPSRKHLFGTDQLGRDVFSRCVYGLRTSLLVAGGAIGLALLLGTALGLLSSSAAGVTDALLNSASNVVLAIPTVVSAIAIVSFVGGGVVVVTVTIAAIATAALYRIARSLSRRVLGELFVTAARCIGASQARIMRREVLPSIAATLVAYGLLGAAAAVGAEGALSYLGLSVPPPEPSLGSVLADGVGVVGQAPHLTVIPTLVVATLVISLNTIARSLSDRADTREVQL